MLLFIIHWWCWQQMIFFSRFISSNQSINEKWMKLKWWDFFFFIHFLIRSFFSSPSSSWWCRWAWFWRRNFFFLLFVWLIDDDGYWMYVSVCVCMNDEFKQTHPIQSLKLFFWLIATMNKKFFFLFNVSIDMKLIVKNNNNNNNKYIWQIKFFVCAWNKVHNRTKV